MKIVSLDEILLTPEIYQAWLEVTKRMAMAIAVAGIDPGHIPDEQARLEDDGSLTIFVRVDNFGELSLKVPPGAWAWRQ